MTIDAASRLLFASLSSIYDEREASAISSMVLERITGMSRSQRLIHKADLLNEPQTILFQQYLSQLMQHRPVQYVLGESWFSGLRFYVDENVLIPRPETEELVAWILADLPAVPSPDFTMLDIGTGSGCIPVSIGKKRKEIRLFACDISAAALNIAKKNSDYHQVPVDFFLCDIRDGSSWERIPALNRIVSNPPYIPERQRAGLEAHVKLYEPELALFVPDNDPILFYKAIGRLAIKKLVPGGKLFLEIHHDFASQIVQWYQDNGFSTELRKDLSGKNRMLLANL